MEHQGYASCNMVLLLLRNIHFVFLSTDKRPWCKYGHQCYRKNPLHKAEFRHGDQSSDAPELSNSISNTPPVTNVAPSSSNSVAPSESISKIDRPSPSSSKRPATEGNGEALMNLFL